MWVLDAYFLLLEGNEEVVHDPNGDTWLFCHDLPGLCVGRG